MSFIFLPWCSHHFTCLNCQLELNRRLSAILFAAILCTHRDKKGSHAANTFILYWCYCSAVAVVHRMEEGKRLLATVIKTGACTRVEFANSAGKGKTHARAGGWVPLKKPIKNSKCTKTAHANFVYPKKQKVPFFTKKLLIPMIRLEEKKGKRDKSMD